MSTTPIHKLGPQGRRPAPTAFAWGSLVGAAFQRLRGHHAVEARSKPRDRVSEAASARALADTYLKNDPRFAADLYAAADRHEQTD